MQTCLIFCCLCRAEGRYIIGGGRGDMLVIRDAQPDDASTYACEAQHTLTGEKRRSPMVNLSVSREYQYISESTAHPRRQRPRLCEACSPDLFATSLSKVYPLTFTLILQSVLQSFTQLQWQQKYESICRLYRKYGAANVNHISRRDRLPRRRHKTCVLRHRQSAAHL